MGVLEDEDDVDGGREYKLKGRGGLVRMEKRGF